MAIATNELTSLVTQFRKAIDAAYATGKFENEILFKHFPTGCCGDAVDLLGQYLLENGIDSYYVCGNYNFKDPELNAQSHAWLTVGALIVDITGDQFKHKSEFLFYDRPVFIGKSDKFHSLFKVKDRDVHPFIGIENLNFAYPRLSMLYKIITEYQIEAIRTMRTFAIMVSYLEVIPYMHMRIDSYVMIDYPKVDMHLAALAYCKT